MQGPLPPNRSAPVEANGEIPPCGLCLRCVRACPTGALEYHHRMWTLNLKRCHLCRACTAVCPNQLICVPGGVAPE